MKYLCLEYRDDKTATKFDELGQRISLTSRHGLQAHLLGDPANATTLRFDKGTISITDQPFSDANDRLSAVTVIEARDLNHAIQLMSQWPGARYSGCLEIRRIQAEP